MFSTAASGGTEFRVLIAVLTVGIPVLGLFYGWSYLTRPSIQSLTDQALHAESPEQQLAAARELTDRGPEATGALREVAAESRNANVVSICLLALSRQRDHESMELFLAKLDADSSTVRSAASKAATALLGRNHHFPVDGPESERQRIKQQMAEDWQAYNGSELFEYNKKRFSGDSSQ